MWAVNGGTLYLIGYVPIEAIQLEGRTVNQHIFTVVAVMLIAFFLCCILYYFNQRQQTRLRKEREEERKISNRRLAEALQAAQVASNSKTMFLSKCLRKLPPKNTRTVYSGTNKPFRLYVLKFGKTL